MPDSAPELYDHPHPKYKRGDRVRATEGPNKGKIGIITSTPTCGVCAQRLIDQALEGGQDAGNPK